MKFILPSLLISISLVFISCGERKTVLQPDSTEPDTTAPITWTQEQSPILITETFTVEEYDSLIIEPGVTVLFDMWTQLMVKGTLLSIGTSTDSIFLTSKDDSHWRGLHFFESAKFSRIEYTAVTHGWTELISIEDTSTVISHCRLQYSQSPADWGSTIIVCRESASPLIEYCLISEYSGKWGCGVACLGSSNPRLVHNDIVCYQSMNQSCVYYGGFLESNYLAAWIWNGTELVVVPDKSLGRPIDQIGDGLCTTTSTDTLCLFYYVDGVTNPQGMPHYIFW
jgi:hypothetical protein